MLVKENTSEQSQRNSTGAKKSLTTFFQIIIVALGVIALVAMIWFPLSEGRAKNLDLFSVYADPFIIYGYLTSVAFFVALYQGFKLLGYIGQNKVFSQHFVKGLRTIKYCAIVLSVLIVIAGVYVRLFYAKDDDPAGFIALCILATFISVVIATVSGVFERTWQKAVDLKSKNDLVL